MRQNTETLSKAFECFTLIGRPTLKFRAVRFFNVGGFIPSVRGVTLDGLHETTARLVDVTPCEQGVG